MVLISATLSQVIWLVCISRERLQGALQMSRCAAHLSRWGKQADPSYKAQGGREERRNQREKHSIPCPATDGPAGATEPAAGGAGPAEVGGGRTRQRERNLDDYRQPERGPLFPHSNPAAQRQSAG